MPQGGSFPLHFDTAAGLDGRCVTAIVYLNPDWEPAHGGELQLFPFPARPVVIPPLLDRMVVFDSRHTLHRVLPYSAVADTPRVCFTSWMSRDRPPADPQAYSKDKKSADAGLRALTNALQQGAEDAAWHAARELVYHPLLYPHVCRLTYDQEWIQSLRESHAPGDALTQTLQRHTLEKHTLERALSSLAVFLKHVPTSELTHRLQDPSHTWFS